MRTWWNISILHEVHGQWEEVEMLQLRIRHPVEVGALQEVLTYLAARVKKLRIRGVLAKDDLLSFRMEADSQLPFSFGDEEGEDFGDEEGEDEEVVLVDPTGARALPDEA